MKLNKSILIILACILFVIIIAIVCKKVTKDDSSKTLELTYSINAGIPFRWEFEIEDESIVKFVKSYEISNENKDGLVGGDIQTNYVFEGLKEGVTTITFRFVRIDEDNVVDTEEVRTVKVDANKNISLVSIPIDKN